MYGTDGYNQANASPTEVVSPFRCVNLTTPDDLYITYTTGSRQDMYEDTNLIFKNSGKLAKVNLNCKVGEYESQNFLTNPILFDPPFSVVTSMRLTVQKPDMKLYDFRDRDYEITLEITEVKRSLKASLLVTRLGALRNINPA